ncbi:hypothetical protein M0R01_03995 [bacterium]|nr:hypothetical protein [bacterium]
MITITAFATRIIRNAVIANYFAIDIISVLIQTYIFTIVASEIIVLKTMFTKRPIIVIAAVI